MWIIFMDFNFIWQVGLLYFIFIDSLRYFFLNICIIFSYLLYISGCLCIKCFKEYLVKKFNIQESWDYD